VPEVLAGFGLVGQSQVLHCAKRMETTINREKMTGNFFISEYLN
jgi:hypothetical protein